MKILAILLIPSLVWAAPFLVSDPQEGIEEHLFECGEFGVITPAEADGSFKYDFNSWTEGSGWFDCTVKSRIKWEAIDGATGETSEVIEESEPADVRIKIPKNATNGNFKVK